MFVNLLLAVFVVVGVTALFTFRKKGKPVPPGVFLRNCLLTGFLLGLVLLTLTGRLPWLAALGGALFAVARHVPLVLKFWPLLERLWRSVQGSAAGGQRSQIRTRFLLMTLDHDSGALDGEVLEGALQGRRLSGLTQAEIQSLRAQLDGESARVLQAWVERTHPDWVVPEAAAPTSPSVAMSEREALEILGLQDGATAADIVSAHRKLIQRLHPDRGGSTWLAAKLNEAKDHLLRTADRR